MELRPRKNPPDDRVPVSPVLLARLTELGVDVDETARRAGLSAVQLEGAKLRLTTAEFFAFWRALDEVAKMRDLGLVLGSEALDQGYSVASTTALHAPNGEAALKTLARYKRLTCPEEVELQIERGEASIRFHWMLAEAAVPRLLVDSSFASFVELVRRGTGTHVVPRRIELARRSSDARMLAEHFGCPIKFGAPYDRLVFDESVLALRFATHDALALTAVVPGLEAELAGKSKVRPFHRELRVAIARHMAVERPTVAKIARRLRISSRTLQRRLEEERTTYQAELDEVRHTTARRLLRNTDFDPVEVAFLLGFEEPNSFSRAFRGWEGTTPTQWRHATSHPASRAARRAPS
ncbi:MAG: helix-turn-helix domain-containing protein [Polyangiaceae bacterium]|nr:helix-turn-helix domain-containing protein [Polyangiaceae bacterium]